MSHTLLRRELALRRLVFYLPGAVVAGALVWGMGRHASLVLGAVPMLDPRRPEGLVPAVIVVWSWLAGYLLGLKPEWRCAGDLDLALPVSPRRLWLTRAFATLAGGGLIVLAAVGAVACGNALAGVRPLLQPGLASFAIHLAAGFALTFALVQSPRPGLGRVPLSAGYVAFVVACFLGYLAVVLGLGALPRVWALAPLAAALALGLRIYRALPAAFSLVPREPQPAAVAGGGTWDAASRRRGGLWLLHSTVFRSSLGDWTWAYLPLLAFHGWILSDRQESTYFPFFFFTWAVLGAWTLATLHGLYRLDPLPISRRRAFAALVVPALLTVIAGYGLGLLVRDRGGPLIAIQRCFGDYCVRVPFELYEIAWDGEVPASGSPWGESARAPSAPLVRGGEIEVYNPFPIPRGSSPDFVALQVRRALAAVYGATLPLEEIRDRHLEADADGRWRLRDGGAQLLRDHPELRRRAALNTFLLVALLVAVPWLAFAALVYGASRGGGGRLARWTLPAVFFTVLGIGSGSLAANAVGLVDLPALSRGAAVLLRRLGGTVGEPLLAILAALALFAVYSLARARFQSLEAPPAGWARGPFSQP